MTKPDLVATYCDHVFEAAQRALSDGRLEDFKRRAAEHRGLAELYVHIRDGGMIH